MTTYQYATSQTTIGLAKEVTRHTPVAPAFWAKAKGPKYVPKLSVLEDDTLQGSAVSVYDQIPGLRYDEHGWSTFPYLDILPLYVLAELGSPDTVSVAPTSTTLSSTATKGATTISTAGSIAANSWITIDTGATIECAYTTAVSGAGPYTITLQAPLIFGHTSGHAVAGLTGHALSLLNNGGNGNQPPALTITDFDGDQWRQIAGAQLDKCGLKFTPDKLADLSVSFMGDASITPTPPAASFSSTQATPGWTVAVFVGGTLLTYVDDVEINLARGVKPTPGFTGNQSFFSYFAGPLTSTAKITVIEQSGAPEIATYLNGTQESFEVVFTDRKSGFGALFRSTNAAFKTASLERGKEYVQSTLDVQLLPTATDATAGGVSPIYVSVGNSQTTSF